MAEAEDDHADENVILEAAGEREPTVHRYQCVSDVGYGTGKIWWKSDCAAVRHFWEYDGICKHCVAVLSTDITSDSHVKAYREKLESGKTGKALMQIPGMTKGNGNEKQQEGIQSAAAKRCTGVKSLPTDPGRHLWKSTAGTALWLWKTPGCCRCSFKLGVDRMYVTERCISRFARADRTA